MSLRPRGCVSVSVVELEWWGPATEGATPSSLNLSIGRCYIKLDVKFYETAVELITFSFVSGENYWWSGAL